MMSLRQGSLQIETGIGRLRRCDGPVHPEGTPAEHVVGGAIDGLDADELPVLVAEGGKRSLRTIAAHHDLVIAGGQARNLQLVVALIAPEPRLTVISLGIAAETRRHTA